MLLRDKTILITGSSQGIGLAAGKAMLAAGASVVFHSEKVLSACPDVVKLIGTPEAFYIQADLLKQGEASRLVEEASQRYGPLDVLVNNVGTFAEPEFTKVAQTDYQRIFQLNVFSVLEASQAYIKLNQAAKKGGRLLFTSSLNATRSEKGHTLYDASKGAINSLVRQLVLEYAASGFTTAAIAPGLIETPLTDHGMKSQPGVRNAVQAQIPLGRIGTVEDVASWLVFLASPASYYATGIVIPIDGGLDAQQMASPPAAS
jgi:glucose 1-dehydrogenase